MSDTKRIRKQIRAIKVSLMDGLEQLSFLETELSHIERSLKPPKAKKIYRKPKLRIVGSDVTPFATFTHYLRDAQDRSKSTDSGTDKGDSNAEK